MPRNEAEGSLTFANEQFLNEAEGSLTFADVKCLDEAEGSLISYQ